MEVYHREIQRSFVIDVATPARPPPPFNSLSTSWYSLQGQRTPRSFVYIFAGPGRGGGVLLRCAATYILSLIVHSNVLKLHFVNVEIVEVVPTRNKTIYLSHTLSHKSDFKI